MKVNITTKIYAAAENIWKTIRAYDNVESFNPLVTSSKITGTEEGSQRVCQIQFGDQQEEVFEILDLVDEENKTIKVSVTKAPAPLGGQQITIQVNSLGENEAQLLISTELSDGNEQASKVIQNIFQMIGSGLKKLHEKEVI